MPRGKRITKNNNVANGRKPDKPYDGFEALGAAIIEKASKEHKAAVTSPDSDDKKKVQEHADVFFRSDLFEIYSLAIGDTMSDGETYLGLLDDGIRHGSDYAGGESLTSIAKEIDEIYSGPERRGKKACMEELDENEEDIRELADNGWTLDRIAERMDCPKRYLSEFAKEHGIRIKGMWNPDETKRRRNRRSKQDGQEK